LKSIAANRSEGPGSRGRSVTASASMKWKRAFDLLVSSIGLVVFSPLLVAVAICILASMGRPIVFRQVRPGLRGEPFTLYKFRTMSEARDESGNLLANDSRLTALGMFLRSSSLDELPELWNVLTGDMSMVGPRPLLMEYLELYTPEQMRRHDLRPGITGWAQVNGRNTASWEDRFLMDVWYVDNCTLWLDMKILVMTIWKVLMRKGISQPGKSTIDRFKGTRGV
jgi:sugar transferase EpsL